MSSSPASIRSAVVFPQPGRADEDEELAVGDLDAQVGHGGGLVEALGDVLERDRCHQTSRASGGSTKCATATKE